MLFHYIARFLPIPFLMVAIIFVLGVSFGIPLADEWRWTKELLIPLIKGDINFTEYLLGEYAFLSHSHYLALLFLYVDYSWFNLNFAYFSYIGLVFYVLGFVSIFYYVKQYSQENAKLNSAALLIIAVGYFCITSDFPWLLVVFEYVYFFIAIVTLLLLDSFLMGRTRLLVLIGTMVACLLLGDTIGMSAVFLCLFALLLNAFTDRSRFKPFFIALVVVGAIFLTQYILLGKGVLVSGHSRLDTLMVMWRNPADVLISFISIFSQPLIDITIFRYSVGERNSSILQFGVGLIGFFFVLSIIARYFKNGGWTRSKLPLIFIGYGVLTWALIFISRYQDYGVSVMDEPRYVRLFTLIYVGAGIAILCGSHDSRSRKCVYFSACVFTLVYCLTVGYKFWQDQYIESYFANAKIELLKQPIDSNELKKYIFRCADEYCAEPIEFMRVNRLSIYR